MTRRELEITDITEILKIMDSTKILHLGLSDGGWPYVVPMNFGYTYADGHMVLTSVIFYNKFQKQVISDLKSHANILLSTQSFLEYVEKDYDPKIDNLRITVVDMDGQVEYDSNADIGKMDNHSDRPEIREAQENGSGYAVRESWST